MPTHLTKDVDASVSARHTYVSSNGLNLADGASIRTVKSLISIDEFSNDPALGTSTSRLVTEAAIKAYVDSATPGTDTWNAGLAVGKTLNTSGIVSITGIEHNLVLSASSGTLDVLRGIEGVVSVGFFVVLRVATGHEILVSSSDFSIGTNFMLEHVYDTMVLMKINTLATDWVEISRSSF